MQTGRKAWIFGVVSVLIGGWSVSGFAAPPAVAPDPSAVIDGVSVPPPLRPWIGWVLYDIPDVECPSVDGVRHCIWPGELAVDVKTKGASFVYRVFVDSESTVALPGSKDFWPQRVRVDDEDGLVRKLGEHPAIRLSKGAHQISGGFDWASTPEVLPVPNDLARVSLSISTEDVDFPRVEQGRLWLGKSGVGDEDSQETIRATIYRKFDDGVPLNVVTRIQLNVSGRAREVSLGRILLDGSVPTRIDSGLPVRLPPEGDISVFVRPGTHEITIHSVIAKPIKTVVAPSPSPNFYDPQEVWVWNPDEQVRSVRLEGVTAVEPDRTSLPIDWHGHATYLVAPATKMTITETRRGMAEPSPNMVKLDRTLWLDLDGGGYTVRDIITGQMNQKWRLNFGKEGTLGRVYDDAEGSDLFITSEPGTALSGVEIRKPDLDLTAELRLRKPGKSLAIVGWDHDVQSLSAHLNLPPGWTLLGGHGVDRMPNTWVESWTLFDFFFVLMVALTLGKLFGWGWTPVSLVALCLAHGHQDAPEWIWIGLLVSLAILRVLPQGWVRKSLVVVRSVMLIALLVILAPYARDQIRHALHPQVGQPDNYATTTMVGELESTAKSIASIEPTTAARAAAQEIDGAELDKAEQKRGEKASLNVASGVDYSKSSFQRLQQIDPNAVVQTGPGLPTWTWSTWDLQWTGPVRKDHKIDLWLVSPMVNGILAFVRVALLILLALLMLAPRDTYWNEPVMIKRTLFTRVLGMAPLLLAVMFAPKFAQAQEVPGSTLDELKRRLVEETLCKGPCAVASRAQIEVDGDDLTMKAEVHAEKLSAWNLPGPSDPLRIDSVKVDGIETDELRRDSSGLVMVRLAAGRHTVEIKGKLVSRNVVTLQFRGETRPQYVQFKSNEWTVDGIGPDGVPDNSLQLTKRVDAGTQDAVLSTDLPPWFSVERRVQLGAPWRIQTVVTRVDDSRPQRIKVPLVGGETVISEGVRMEDSRAVVDFPRGAKLAEFTSEIPISPKVELTASKAEPFTETWYVQCTRIWRCKFSDLPRIADVEDGVLQPMWQPWPGEKLTISVDRPQGAPGQAVTVDAVHYDVTPGKRLLKATLEFMVRASQGGVHEVTLPAGAELQHVRVDGQVRAIRPREQVVSLPVKPGEQKFELQWQQPWERSIHEVAPSVKLSTTAVNADTVFHLGEDRWLLWTHGPAWGPAILFWSHLAVLIVMAFLLGRLRGLPIKTWEWLLLVIGLSQLPVIAGLPILVWFLLLAWRGRNANADWWQIVLAQLAILFLTVVSVGVLSAAIHFNLLVDVDMQVRGAGSTDSALRWYVDQTAPELATPGIVSLPILAFRFAMLLWALWLVSRLIKWGKWGWGEFSKGGLWRTYPRPVKKPNRKTKVGAPTRPAATPIPPENTSLGVGPETGVGPESGERGRTEPSSSESRSMDPQEPRRREATTIPGAPVSNEPLTLDDVPSSDDAGNVPSPDDAGKPEDNDPGETED